MKTHRSASGHGSRIHSPSGENVGAPKPTPALRARQVEDRSRASARLAGIRASSVLPAPLGRTAAIRWPSGDSVAAVPWPPAP